MNYLHCRLGLEQIHQFLFFRLGTVRGYVGRNLPHSRSLRIVAQSHRLFYLDLFIDVLGHGGDSRLDLECPFGCERVPFTGVWGFGVLLHVVSEFFAISVHELVSFWLFVELNFGSSVFSPDFLGGRGWLIFIGIVIWVFEGVLWGFWLSDLLRMVDFDVNAFFIAHRVGFAIFDGVDDSGLIVAGFETFL